MARRYACKIKWFLINSKWPAEVKNWQQGFEVNPDLRRSPYSCEWLSSSTSFLPKLCMWPMDSGEEDQNDEFIYLFSGNCKFPALKWEQCHTDCFKCTHKISWYSSIWGAERSYFFRLNIQWDIRICSLVPYSLMQDHTVEHIIYECICTFLKTAIVLFARQEGEILDDFIVPKNLI